MTTPNYGWPLIQPTDFVTDLPADLETLADAIDDTLHDLNPETTAGDISFLSATPDVKTRLGIGTAGQVLAVNSGATAPEWATPAGGSDDFTLINTGGTALTGSATITVSGISNKNRLLIWVAGASSTSASSSYSLRFNTDTGSNYNYVGQFFNPTTYGSLALATDDRITVVEQGNNAGDVVNVIMHLDGANAAGIKPFTFSSRANGSTTTQTRNMNGFYFGTSTISSVSILSNTGDFDAGTIYIYGA